MKMLEKHKHISKTSVLAEKSKPFFQAKLTVNDPNDQYEREADAVADQVMRMPQPSVQRMPGEHLFAQSLFPSISSLQRKCQHCEDEEKKMQRKEKTGNTINTNNNFENYVGNLDSSGQPLSKELRTFFEPRFGYDFSQVKVHTGTVAAKSAQSINALAYTSGNNIVFNNGTFSPHTESGKKLLGHELTHVVQQQAGRTTEPGITVNMFLCTCGSGCRY